MRSERPTYGQACVENGHKVALERYLDLGLKGIWVCGGAQNTVTNTTDGRIIETVIVKYGVKRLHLTFSARATESLTLGRSLRTRLQSFIAIASAENHARRTTLLIWLNLFEPRSYYCNTIAKLAFNLYGAAIPNRRTTQHSINHESFNSRKS